MEVQAPDVHRDRVSMELDRAAQLKSMHQHVNVKSEPHSILHSPDANGESHHESNGIARPNLKHTLPANDAAQPALKKQRIGIDVNDYTAANDPKSALHVSIPSTPIRSAVGSDTHADSELRGQLARIQEWKSKASEELALLEAASNSPHHQYVYLHRSQPPTVPFASIENMSRVSGSPLRQPSQQPFYRATTEPYFPSTMQSPLQSPANRGMHLDATNSLPTQLLVTSPSSHASAVDALEARRADIAAKIQLFQRTSGVVLPIGAEPPRNKTHWDYLLVEAQWMATDFAREKKWKLKMAKKLSKAVLQYHARVKESELREARAEVALRRKMAAIIANNVRQFWQNIGRLVHFKIRYAVDIEKRASMKLFLDSFFQATQSKSQTPTPEPSQSAVPNFDSTIFETLKYLNVTGPRIRHSSVSRRPRFTRHASSNLPDQTDSESIASTSTPSDTDFDESSESDDESTLSDAEAIQAEDETTDYQSELTDLHNDASLSIEELRLKYVGRAESPSDEIDDEGVNVDVEVRIGDNTPDTDHIVDNDSLDAIIQSNCALASSFRPVASTLSDQPIRTPVPSALCGRLRDYQAIALDWLVSMHNNGFNAILADEQGLGKRVQCISLLAWLVTEKQETGHNLIIVPTSMVSSWEIEIQRWCPSLRVLTYAGTKNDRRKQRRRWFVADLFHICLTSYSTFVADAYKFRRKEWNYVILDDAQLIKNFSNQRWQTLVSLKTSHRLLLTDGIPQSSMLELAALIQFLMPSLLHSSQQVREWLSASVDPSSDDFARRSAFITQLQKTLAPFILQRSQSSVVDQLPRRYEHTVPCPLVSRQHHMYHSYLSHPDTIHSVNTGDFVSIVDVLMRLRRICDHPDLIIPRPITASFQQIDPIRLHISGIVSDINPTDEHNQAISLAPSLFRLMFSRLHRLGDFSLSQSVETLQLPSTVFDDLTNDYHHEQHPMYGIALLLDDNAPDAVIEPKLISEPVIVESCRQLKATRLEWRRERRAGMQRLNSIRCSSKETQPFASMSESLVFMLSLIHASTVTQHQALSQTFSDSDTLDLPRHVLITHPELSRGEYHQDQPLVVTLEQRVSLAEHFHAFQISLPRVISPSPIADFTYSSNPSCDILRSIQSSIIHDAADTSLSLFHPWLIRSKLHCPDPSSLPFDSGKLQQLAIMLRSFKASGHRCLIFSQFTHMLDLLERFLDMLDHRYLRVNDVTDLEQRSKVVRTFNDSAKYFVLLSSTRFSHGFEVYGTDVVILYDTDWNPSIDAQIRQQCVRISQMHDINVYRLVTVNTIEINVMEQLHQQVTTGPPMSVDELCHSLGWQRNDISRSVHSDDSEEQRDHSRLPITGALNRYSADEIIAIMTNVEDDVDRDLLAAAQRESESHRSEVVDLANSMLDVDLRTSFASTFHRPAGLDSILTPVQRYALFLAEHVDSTLPRNELSSPSQTIPSLPLNDQSNLVRADAKDIPLSSPVLTASPALIVSRSVSDSLQSSPPLPVSSPSVELSSVASPPSAMSTTSTLPSVPEDSRLPADEGEHAQDDNEPEHQSHSDHATSYHSSSVASPTGRRVLKRKRVSFEDPEIIPDVDAILEDKRYSDPNATGPAFDATVILPPLPSSLDRLDDRDQLHYDYNMTLAEFEMRYPRVSMHGGDHTLMRRMHETVLASLQNVYEAQGYMFEDELNDALYLRHDDDPYDQPLPFADILPGDDDYGLFATKSQLERMLGRRQEQLHFSFRSGIQNSRLKVRAQYSAYEQAAKRADERRRSNALYRTLSEIRSAQLRMMAPVVASLKTDPVASALIEPPISVVSDKDDDPWVLRVPRARISGWPVATHEEAPPPLSLLSDLTLFPAPSVSATLIEPLSSDAETDAPADVTVPPPVKPIIPQGSLAQFNLVTPKPQHMDSVNQFPDLSRTPSQSSPYTDEMVNRDVVSSNTASTSSPMSIDSSPPVHDMQSSSFASPPPLESVRPTWQPQKDGLLFPPARSASSTTGLVSPLFTAATSMAPRVRPPPLEDINRALVPWTVEEDDALIQGVNKYGPNWLLIQLILASNPRFYGRLRTTKECHQRYLIVVHRRETGAVFSLNSRRVKPEESADDDRSTISELPIKPERPDKHSKKDKDREKEKDKEKDKDKDKDKKDKKRDKEKDRDRDRERDKEKDDDRKDRKKQKLSKEERKKQKKEEKAAVLAAQQKKKAAMAASFHPAGFGALNIFQHLDRANNLLRRDAGTVKTSLRESLTATSSPPVMNEEGRANQPEVQSQHASHKAAIVEAHQRLGIPPNNHGRLLMPLQITQQRVRRDAQRNQQSVAQRQSQQQAAPMTEQQQQAVAQQRAAAVAAAAAQQSVAAAAVQAAAQQQSQQPQLPPQLPQQHMQQNSASTAAAIAEKQRLAALQAHANRYPASAQPVRAQSNTPTLYPPQASYSQPPLNTRTSTVPTQPPAQYAPPQQQMNHHMMQYAQPPHQPSSTSVSPVPPGSPRMNMPLSPNAAAGQGGRRLSKAGLPMNPKDTHPPMSAAAVHAANVARPGLSPPSNQQIYNNNFNAASQQIPPQYQSANGPPAIAGYPPSQYQQQAMRQGYPQGPLTARPGPQGNFNNQSAAPTNYPYPHYPQQSDADHPVNDYPMSRPASASMNRTMPPTAPLHPGVQQYHPQAFNNPAVEYANTNIQPEVNAMSTSPSPPNQSSGSPHGAANLTPANQSWLQYELSKFPALMPEVHNILQRTDISQEQKLNAVNTIFENAKRNAH